MLIHLPSAADSQLVNDFWSEYVDGFIFGDLERAIAAHDNYLVALGEMCYIDYLGKLIRGRRGSEKNFKRFVIDYMPNYVPFLDGLYGEVRCGLVHSYFPDNVDVIGITWTISGLAIRKVNGRWKIAVHDFLNEMKEATNAFKADLLSGKNLHKFKAVVTSNPGVDRIGRVSHGAIVGAPIGTSSTVVTTSGSIVRAP